jgi:hypothetical protein
MSRLAPAARNAPLDIERKVWVEFEYSVSDLSLMGESIGALSQLLRKISHPLVPVGFL